MSIVFRRQIPLTLTFIITISLLATYFFDLGGIGSAYEDTMLSFATVVLSAALGLGIINLLMSHIKKISQKSTGRQWIYSIILLASMGLMIVVGFMYGADSDEFSLLFDATVSPLGATLMSLFIVWIAPALYRAVRVRNIPSGLLILALIIVLFGGSPVGPLIWPGFNTIAEWLNSVPGMAAQRGMKITMALGIIIMSIRIITGKEASWLRKEAGS